MLFIIKKKTFKLKTKKKAMADEVNDALASRIAL